MTANEDCRNEWEEKSAKTNKLKSAKPNKLYSQMNCKRQT